MINVGLLVKLEAKKGLGPKVAEFLKSAMPLVQAEDKTPIWFAYQEDDETFYITDAFENDEDRNGHLQGPIAKALMSAASELLARDPQIVPVNVLAHKF